MDKIKTLLTDCFENIKTVVTTKYAREAEVEDPHAYGLLLEHLALKNAHRIILFSVFSFIAGLICVIAGEHSVVGIAGSVVLMLTSAVFIWLMCRTAFESTPNLSLIKMFTYIYWVAITVGCVLVAVSEQAALKTPYFFLIFIAAALAVPVPKFYESLFFAAVMIIYGIAYGITVQRGILYYISVLAVVVAYVWLSSVVRCCYTSLWLGRRRIDNTEERCIQISRKDTLTGLLNKAGLAAKFSEMSANRGGTISVVMVDVDNFRIFNHMYGYDRSDECLYRICNCMRIVAKPYTELVSRFGGDEFVLVFEGMKEVDVVKLAEQIRQSIETMAQTFGNSIVTVSVGVSGAKQLQGNNTYAELLNEADKQLMIAKASGRNCIGFKGRPFIHESRHSPFGSK